MNLDRARALVRQVVDEVGEDYIYVRPEGGSCVYQYNGQPSCLVGQVLYRDGWTIDQLHFLDFRGSAFIVGTNAYELQNEEMGARVTPLAANYLEKVQRGQDDGYTWADAYCRAEQEFGHVSEA